MSFAENIKLDRIGMNRLESLNQMLESNPNDLFLNYALAMEYMSANDDLMAIEKLEWIRSISPGYLPVYYQLAGLHEKLGKTEMAVEVYRTGIVVAEEQNELKTMNELRSALDELIF